MTRVIDRFIIEREGTDHDDTSGPGPSAAAPRTQGRPAPFAAQRGRGAARGAPRAVQESPGQGGRAGVAGVREAGPGPRRAVRHRLRLHRGRPDAGDAGAARAAAAAPCPGVRCGPRSLFVGPAFQAAERGDLDRLARGTGGTVAAHQGGHAVLLQDPSGFPGRVVHGIPELPALPGRAPLPLNVGTEPVRANATQRPARRPAEIQRLGHVVLGRHRFRAALDWYLDTLGLIVSDFLYLDGQRDRGPAMAFIRCDLGSVPADHHTLAMALQPHTGYLHSAYQLTDLDEVAASGEYLREQGYRHAWGLGRHIQGH